MLVEFALEPLFPTGAGVMTLVRLLPLVPVRGVCAKLHDAVAIEIAISPTLIDVI
jgi:hypothetical protein